jgi:energy-converting hydrogenase Eha subunit H
MCIFPEFTVLINACAITNHGIISWIALELFMENAFAFGQFRTLHEDVFSFGQFD